MGFWSSLFGGKPRGIVFLEGEDEFECNVVGESHYQANIDQIVGGKTRDGHEHECMADLVPEPDNRHDPNAIAVEIDGLKVGYLSRPHAKVLTKILRSRRLAGAQAKAVIVGGWTGWKGAEDGHYGVRLDIPV